MSDSLLSTPEAATYLGVHVYTLHRWIKDGKVAPTGYTAGGQMRFGKTYLRQIRRGRFRTAGKGEICVLVEYDESLLDELTIEEFERYVREKAGRLAVETIREKWKAEKQEKPTADTLPTT